MSQAPPTLVSLGAGPQQVPFIEAARHLGLSVVSVDRNPKAPGHALADHALALSTHEVEPILAALAELGPALDIQGVVCRSTGPALQTQALLADALGVHGLTSEAVMISTSKSELRRFCVDHRLPMPRGARVTAQTRVSLSLPVVVKPDYTIEGKRDVRRVDSSAALADAVADAAGSSWNGLAEVESFVDGIDVACVFWAEGGRAEVLTFYDEVLGFAADGRVVPLGVSAPSLIDERSRSRLADLAGAFAARLPGTSALLILCARVDGDGQPHVIELHADLGGDRIAEELLPASIPDFDYFEMVVALATGRAVQRPRHQHRPVALLYRGPTDCGKPGAEHLRASELVALESRAELLAELRREVERRAGEVVVQPPVLRLGRAA